MQGEPLPGCLYVHEGNIRYRRTGTPGVYRVEKAVRADYGDRVCGWTFIGHVSRCGDSWGFLPPGRDTWTSGCWSRAEAADHLITLYRPMAFWLG